MPSSKPTSRLRKYERAAISTWFEEPRQDQPTRGEIHKSVAVGRNSQNSIGERVNKVEIVAHKYERTLKKFESIVELVSFGAAEKHSPKKASQIFVCFLRRKAFQPFVRSCAFGKGFFVILRKVSQFCAYVRMPHGI